MKKIVTTFSQQETIALGKCIGEHLNHGIVITLTGELGSGKTTFTKGLGIGLEIAKEVNSPTFVISKIYHGRLDLVHIDAYRLEGLKQDLGLQDYFVKEWVSVIEWPQYIEHLLPKQVLAVKLEVTGEDQRSVTFECDEQVYEIIKDCV